MRYVQLISACVLMPLALGCAGTQEKPDGPVVRDIAVDGADKVSAGDIKAKILTSEDSWLPFTDEPTFDPSTWQADLRRVERFYQAQGYYDAKVVEDEVVSVKNGVKLRLRVDEGEPTRIARIDIAGMEDIPPEFQAEALEELPLQVGDIFRESAWVGVKETIQARLRERGYAEAEVRGAVRVNADRREAIIELTAVPGRRYKFGNIFVATDANAKVVPRRIVEQAQAAIRKDQWYTESALAEAQARVFKMGVFGAVKVNRGAPDRAEGVIPVVIDVREAPFHTIRLGGGLGLDLARHEGRLIGEYTDRNIVGGLRRLTVGGKVGWAFLPTVWGATGLQSRLGLPPPDTTPTDGPIFELRGEFEQPRFLLRDLRLQTSLAVARRLEPAYSQPIWGQFRTGVVWQPHPDISIFPSYNFEGYQLEIRSDPGSLAGDTTFGCPAGTTRCFQLLSYLEQTLEWDKRDSRTEPKSGFFAALSVQEGGGPLRGDFTYLRFLPDFRYYHSFGETRRFTVATKLRLGSIIPFPPRSQSPIEVRFFSGGSAHRGFSAKRLAPLWPNGNPIGGDSLVEASLEARYNISRSFVGAVFADSGFVGTRSFQGPEHLSQLYHAVGVGIRYLTVVGPIRLDLARRLNIGPPLPVVGGESPDAVSELPARSGCFGIGGTERTFAGSPDGLCQFHLSIGEAF